MNKDKLHEIKINQLLKKARSRMVTGFAYTISDLVDVDSLSDIEIKDLMIRLNNHPLICIDSNFPRKWSRR